MSQRDGGPKHLHFESLRGAVTLADAISADLLLFSMACKALGPLLEE